ncbi:hypothetical protein LCGC14_0322830 [marine sediment metagenome]|uniref:KOW domain-containing protein n=1 Tax=marine sediment metagenome TaxID=412755 RepID=A0A0F9TP07_9ZZZZ
MSATRLDFSFNIGQQLLINANGRGGKVGKVIGLYMNRDGIHFAEVEYFTDQNDRREQMFREEDVRPIG